MLRPVRIRHYLALMKERGFPEEQVLAGSSVDSQRLQDAAYLIDAGQCRRVIANMLQLSDDPALGFEAGCTVEPADLGIVGYAAMSCRTMRETCRIWQQYSASLVGVMSSLVLREDDDECIHLTITEPPVGDAIYRFCVEEILVMMFKVGKALCGVEPVLKRLELAYPAPPHRAHYLEQFRCALQFGAERSHAVIARQWLDAPLRTGDAEFNKICLQHCGQILQQIEQTGPVSARLREIFLRSPAAIPRLDDAAQMLAMSARTLRRHLHEEATSYQTLVDEFRADLACEYLRSTRMSTKEIAYLLGFRDHSAFRHSFKSWTGRTTREYRSQALQTG